MTMDERISGYARGIFEMAQGEGELERVEEELLAISRAFDTSPELRANLTDLQLPLDRKQGIIDGLIGGRASSLTVGLVQLLVGHDRASELPAIAMAVAEAAASSRERALAEVRSAVALDDETVERLAAALGRATGKRVEVKVIVDPSVIGGIIARVGDTVIDGSIATRVDSARQAVRSK
jgi:F-type H+-transporting ATPase subunit delta